MVLRIYRLFLDGHGYLAIAERLTAQQIPPPSGHDRVRNPHRLGVAWGKSAVRAILENPRYTGYQVWNKQRRDEVLLDIDDVAAGHVTKMRWNPRDQWVYSAEPTHPPLVSPETFDQVQARIAARSRTSPRPAQGSPRPYVLRGRLLCGLCRRRLQGQWIRGEAYYRCRYPSEYAHSAGLDHPGNVYLREADLTPKLDAWLARLVSPANIEATCRRLAAAQPTGRTDPNVRAAQQALADCQRKLARHRAALEAGGDPAVINQWIAETLQQQRHAQHTLDQLHAAHVSQHQPSDPAMVRALLEELGDLAAGLDLADPQQRARFYQAMGISGLYQPAKRIVLITAEPGIRRPTVRVGGPDWTTGPTRVHHTGGGVEPCRGIRLVHKPQDVSREATHTPGRLWLGQLRSGQRGARQGHAKGTMGAPQGLNGGLSANGHEHLICSSRVFLSGRRGLPSPAHPGRPPFADHDAALAGRLRWLGQSAGQPTKILYRPKPAQKARCSRITQESR